MNLTDSPALKFIIESAPIGICILRAEDFVAEMVNDKFLEIAGKPKDSILGKWYWEAFAEAKDQYEQSLNNVVSSKRAYHADEVPLMLIRNGIAEWIYVTFVYAPVMGAGDSVSKVAVWVLENTREVLERDKIAAANKATEQERDKLKKLLYQAPIGITVLSGKELTIELVNPKYQALLPDRNLLGRPFLEALPELVDTSIGDALLRVYETGIEAEFQDQLVPISEEENGPTVDRFFNFTFFPRSDSDGFVDGIFIFAFEVTPLVQGMLQVEQANNNLEQILNMLPASVVVIRGYDLIIEMINDSNLAYWMKNREDVVGKRFLDILPDLADQPFAGQLRQVMKTGEVIDVKESPVLFTEKNGSIRETYVDYTYQPLSDLNGNFNGVLVMSFEITDRVRSRKLLEKYATELSSANHELSISNNNLAISEARFKYLIAEAPVAIGVLHSRDMIIETANQRILEVWGKTSDILHQPIALAIPELEGQPFLGLLDKVYTSGEAFYADEIRALLEHQGILKEIYFNMVYQPLIDQSGAVSDIVVVAVDVTQQVTARKKVEQAELTMRLAVEAGNVGTWSIDTKSHHFNTSVRLKEMFGFDIDHEISVDITLLQITEEYRAHVISVFNDVMVKGGNCDIIFTITRVNDNKLRWIRALGSNNKVTDLDNSTFAGVILDITDIKLEEQRKGDFIGMVSHELKTPLTSLNGYLQIMHRKAKAAGNDSSLAAFENSLKQVRQMTTLINGFLNISRLESGKIHIERSCFDFAELFREIEIEHQHLHTSHQLVFHGKEKAFINADREKIAQVINNLVSNAVKYSPIGTKVELSYVCSNEQLRIQVSDQGIGIKAEDIPRLFERYYRVENMTNVSGFGIGLYLCAEIIERHDGKIWAESTPGCGSVFYFEIPVKASQS